MHLPAICFFWFRIFLTFVFSYSLFASGFSSNFFFVFFFWFRTFNMFLFFHFLLLVLDFPYICFFHILLLAIYIYILRSGFSFFDSVPLNLDLYNISLKLLVFFFWSLVKIFFSDDTLFFAAKI